MTERIICGSRYSTFVPKIKLTCGKRRKSFFAMPSCCIIQPQMPMIMPGFASFSSFNAPILPIRRFSA